MPHAPTHTEAASAPASTWRTRRTARRRAQRAAPTPLTVPALETSDRDVALPQGTIRVREVGSGPTLLFVHGLLVDGRVWNGVAAQLADRFHCVMPDLPLGSHRTPMAPSSDRSPEGIARLLSGLVDALGLADVTVVANDSGGAITQLWMDQGAPGVARVVLTPCDCFEHFLPPGFSVYQWLAHVPGAMPAILQTTRLRVVRQLPTVYGGLTHRAIDDALLRSWLAPAMADAGIRRDTVAFLRGISSARLTAAEQRLGGFDRPVLLAWAPEQAWFPIEDARRLQAILPDARLLEIAGSGAFAGLEQPRAVADAIAAFAAAA